MATGRTVGLLWAVAMVWLLFAVNAQAAVELRRAPAGWADTPSADAVARAEVWADTLDGRLSEVLSTRGDDGYAETLALIGLSGSMSTDAHLDPEAALVRAFGPLFDGPPSTARLVDGTANAPVIAGEWEDDGTTFEVAVVSVGPTRAAVVLAVQSSERTLYARVFEDVLSNLSGAAPPLAPFNLQRWRIGIAVGWALFLVLAWIIVGGTARGRDGAGAVGQTVAVACVLVALIVASVAFVSLEDSEASLQLSGINRARAAVEVAVGGIATALFAWFAGAVRDSTVRRVESAPTGGTFSGSARTMSSNLVPPTKPAVLTDPGHGMTPEALDEADREAMRKPKPTLVGAPSLASLRAEEQFDRVWAAAQAAAEAAVDRPEPEPEPEPSAPKQPENTLVGPAPSPRRKPKTKTEVLQFPPPMKPSEDES